MLVEAHRRLWRCVVLAWGVVASAYHHRVEGIALYHLINTAACCYPARDPGCGMAFAAWTLWWSWAILTRLSRVQRR